MIYEFKCTNGHVTEHYMPMSERDSEPPCNCGATSRRILSVPNFKLDPVSGDFPTATDKFARMHEQAGKRSDDQQN